MAFLELITSAANIPELFFYISVGITTLMALSYAGGGLGFDPFDSLVDPRDAYTWEFTAAFAFMILVSTVLYYIVY